MLVAVVSDTHGMQEYITKVRNKIKHADVLIHLGDNIEDLDYISKGFLGKVYGVRGNCDFTSKYPNEQVIEIDGITIFICHGHKYGVKSDLTSLYFKAKEVGAQIVLFGHSHHSLIVEEGGCWFVNPGSPSLPRMCKNSIAFIEITENKIIYPYLSVI